MKYPTTPLDVCRAVKTGVNTLGPLLLVFGRANVIRAIKDGLLTVGQLVRLTKWGERLIRDADLGQGRL